jgi:hypothetical protein
MTHRQRSRITPGSCRHHATDGGGWETAFVSRAAEDRDRRQKISAHRKIHGTLMGRMS